jgi:pimeloyl-ACP methyl ester carboxylesterase
MFNILVHDQRGHGKSSTPKVPCTIPLLARDVAYILDYLRINQPIHAIIGVSQGGATALSFAAQFPQRTKAIVACDTGPRTAPGNKEAWEERIKLGKSSETGMEQLANVTVARWHASGSKCYPGSMDKGLVRDSKDVGERQGRIEALLDMVKMTSVDGFALGAGALMEYDLIDIEKEGIKEHDQKRNLLDVGTSTGDPKVLLIAGSLDGGGKIAEGMATLQSNWNDNIAGKGSMVEMKVIDGAGHLPMIDETEKFWEILEAFLRSV